MIDITGRTFGRLVVLRQATTEEKSNAAYKHDKTIFWLTRCECGTDKIYPGKRMRTGEVLSCGCMKGNIKALGESAKWACFRWYAANAKRRGIEFLLTLEQFLEITGSSCAYCGVIWSTQYPDYKKKNGKDKYFGAYRRNGIDRINSKIGYISTNCVPCCKTCNFAKAEMSVVEFKNWIERVHAYFIQRIAQEQPTK